MDYCFSRRNRISRRMNLVLLFTWMMCLNRYITCKNVKYKIYEEQAVGTVIARLSEDLEGGQSKVPNIRFRAMQRSVLSVREDNGEISIGTKIDREQLCQKNLNCSIEFDVITLPTQHLQLFHVVVEVLDINDNAPQFSRALIPLEISESAAVGTRIPLDSAYDPDVGENSLYTYSLSDNDFFRIEVKTRTDGAKYAELIVDKQLDRELQSSYELQLTASDMGVPQRFGSSILKISVSDSNDNSPVFERQSYVIHLPENSPVGTLLIDLNATDPDEGDNGKVEYSFSSHMSPQITDTFKIDIDKGKLTLIKSVDYETTKSYEIDVQAQDLGPNAMPALCKIIINVVDVNDNKPEININLMSQGKEIAYISEGAPLETFVALVRVLDKDSGLNGEVVCKLHGHGQFKLQKTYENNYLILTNSTLDREKRSEYSLTVIAEDKGIPSLSTVKHFAVQVSDENDNSPRFQTYKYEVVIVENNSPGTHITSVRATDPDQGENGQVTYTILESLIQGHSITTYVTIDPSNGAIYALRSFDHEETNQITFIVQARDGGMPQLATNATVILTVIDENDNAPVIVTPILHNSTADVSIPRDVESCALITKIKATDKDSGINSELNCYISEGNKDDIFIIDHKLCEIYINTSMETYTNQEWKLLILVQDKGSPPRSSKALLRYYLESLHDESSSQPDDVKQATVDVSMIIIISLGAICAVLLVIMVIFATRCNREKKDNRSYNCRVAESTYQNHPKRPSRQIHKGDITLVPTLNGTLPIRSHHMSSPSPSPTLERGQMSSRQSQHSRQSLNSLMTISSNHVPDNFSLELSNATPAVEVSQLLSMLHQGQYQPRPSFRGNKYSRSYRYALQDMDKFSLKDSGRGDSEAGDSDYDLGRDSPIDRFLGEGFSELFLTDGHRIPPVMRFCTDECRVLGHSDQCWMPPLPSPSADYRNNMFVPGEDLQSHQQQPQNHQQQQTQLQVQQQTPLLEDDMNTIDQNEKKKSFSTFGKESQDEESAETCTSSLLTEMNNVFQRLLPPSIDNYTECNDMDRSNSLERRKGQVASKTSSYPQGVAAWAASSHFQNPNNVGTPLGNHSSAQPSSKWLPAMEEIPENYEEDDFDNVLNHLNDGKHELMDASELVAEINKLLQDVRQN
ncbi:protocadherin-18 isoform X2 [Pelobates cultripes]|uniref:Protocadherin-18 isoform X2 n=1 Tax=Pelobates cultripes TaxID=61616 RepID=A0AAD1SI57_PELCU|nr:protocadherin-18 isoform X2 [Pelobates cultripes]